MAGSSSTSSSSSSSRRSPSRHRVLRSLTDDSHDENDKKSPPISARRNRKSGSSSSSSNEHNENEDDEEDEKGNVSSHSHRTSHSSSSSRVPSKEKHSTSFSSSSASARFSPQLLILLLLLLFPIISILLIGIFSPEMISDVQLAYQQYLESPSSHSKLSLFSSPLSPSLSVDTFSPLDLEISSSSLILSSFLSYYSPYSSLLNPMGKSPFILHFVFDKSQSTQMRYKMSHSENIFIHLNDKLWSEETREIGVKNHHLRNDHSLPHVVEIDGENNPHSIVKVMQQFSPSGLSPSLVIVYLTENFHSSHSSPSPSSFNSNPIVHFQRLTDDFLSPWKDTIFIFVTGVTHNELVKMGKGEDEDKNRDVLREYLLGIWGDNDMTQPLVVRIAKNVIKLK